MPHRASHRLAVRFHDELLVVPAEAATGIEAFRRWSVSSDFPERGRIDYLDGAIEVDMTPERLETHGNPKGKIHAAVLRIVEEENLGRVYVDRTRLYSGPAGLSCEPDVLFVSLQSLRRGRVRFVPAAAGTQDFVEVEGAADLAVEVVSDGSVEKDTRLLPPLYAAAGVRELWLVDCRGEPIDFRILHLRAGRYVQARSDADGYRLSHVLGRRFRLRRQPWELPGTWLYHLDQA
jgi:Uma2 family endonuclease